MIPETKVSTDEFLRGLDALDVSPHLRFRRFQSGDPKEHDYIFLVCRQDPNQGAHIGRTCACCKGFVQINDYDHFKHSMTEEQYDAVLSLLFDYAYTDVEYKEIK